MRFEKWAEIVPNYSMKICFTFELRSLDNGPKSAVKKTIPYVFFLFFIPFCRVFLVQKCWSRYQNIKR